MSGITPIVFEKLQSWILGSGDIEAEYDLKTGGQTLKKKIFNKINITKDFKVD